MDEDFGHTRLQQVAPLAANRLGDNLDGRNVLAHDEKRNDGAVVRPRKDTLYTYTSVCLEISSQNTAADELLE